jgi:tRNA pseudouridine38-40 synthase
MARYQMILAYDGTGYAGFQRQVRTNNKPTIQAVVERSLRELGWQDRTILAAGRTDAGVHATGQVVAFDLDWKHSIDDLLRAINAHLPNAISVRGISQAEPDFHPRYLACSRRYRYRIFCDDLRDPLRERYAWRVWPEVDFIRLNFAAARLVGEQDFSAFGSPPHVGGSTIREVFEASWRSEANEMIFEISASAFLFRMVRRLVSFQVSIGQGRNSLEMLDNCLRTGSKQLVKNVAPAAGLCLVEVIFKDQDGSRDEKD